MKKTEVVLEKSVRIINKMSGFVGFDLIAIAGTAATLIVILLPAIQKKRGIG